MSRHNAPALFPALIISALAMGIISALAKDQGPVNATCDQFDKSTQAWRDCAVATPASAGPAVVDAELFYAGYWLAKMAAMARRWITLVAHTSRTRGC